MRHRLGNNADNKVVENLENDKMLKFFIENLNYEKLGQSPGDG
jgi:hypothetical protein